MKYDKQPIARVQWVKREKLTANDYNPNKVASPEMHLLKQSILEDGWTQPIVALEDGTIVDGFHRWTISADAKVSALTDGHVPVVFIAADPVHRRMSTIRHNRARGTHHVLPMAKIIQMMIDEGVDPHEIMARLGMEDEEVERLAARVGLPLKIEQTEFSSAWKPDFSK